LEFGGKAVGHGAGLRPDGGRGQSEKDTEVRVDLHGYVFIDVLPGSDQAGGGLDTFFLEIVKQISGICLRKYPLVAKKQKRAAAWGRQLHYHQ
jgi:hypothetical protein